MFLVTPKVPSLKDGTSLPAKLTKEVRCPAHATTYQPGQPVDIVYNKTLFERNEQGRGNGYAFCRGLVISQLWLDEFELIPQPQPEFVIFE